MRKMRLPLIRMSRQWGRNRTWIEIDDGFKFGVSITFKTAIAMWNRIQKKKKC